MFLDKQSGGTRFGFFFLQCSFEGFTIFLYGLWTVRVLLASMLSLTLNEAFFKKLKDLARMMFSGYAHDNALQIGQTF